MPSRAIIVLSFAVAGGVSLAAYGLSVHAEAAPHEVVATLPAVQRTRESLGTDSNSLVGVFEGRTPCGAIATDFTGVPPENCEKIKWKITLSRDPTTGNPTDYAFKGTRATRQGKWRIARGLGGDRNRVVYHLDYSGSPNRRTDLNLRDSDIYHVADGGRSKVLSLLAVDENVLLLLDRELNVLVGDASWSYALNRIDLPGR
jgi:hypothetical protein